MDISLLERKALVCGASQGIGAAVAKELADNGASVTICARNEEKLVSVCNSLPSDKGQTHSYLCFDAQDPSNVREIISEHIKSHGNYQILINNSGGPNPGAAAEAKIEDFIVAFNQHLLTSQVLLQGLLPGMKSSGFGRVINIISTSVKQPIKGLGVSNTIRGAVANWSKTLADELGGFGITVNNVLPGATQTQRLESIFENKSIKFNKSLENIVEDDLRTIPAARFAKPYEIANVVSFLASTAASYVNGINVPVDGGRTNSL